MQSNYQSISIELLIDWWSWVTRVTVTGAHATVTQTESMVDRHSQSLSWDFWLLVTDSVTLRCPIRIAIELTETESDWMSETQVTLSGETNIIFQ